MSTVKHKLTADTMRSLGDLQKEYGISPGEVKILSTGEPWLNSATRLRIARASDRFVSIITAFVGFFEEPSTRSPRDVQVIYNTAVVDCDGRTFEMPGVATIGEKLWNGDEADAHDLAKSRSIASALDAAGWNPLGRTRPVKTETQREEADAADESVEAAQRVQDLKRIHAVARTVGLIRGTDERLYRRFLKEFYRTDTSGAMDAMQRHSLIDKLLAKGPAFARGDDRRPETGDRRPETEQ